MATHQGKDLPADILSKITKLLNTDVDNLRLRSVCSSWRTSLPPLSKPFSFPLKLPPLTSFASETLLFEDDELTQSNPNTFTLLNPITMEEMGEKDNPNIPNSVNLLDYIVSEIGKYHTAYFSISGYLNRKDKVIALRNYVTGFDIVVLTLEFGGLKYWKFGDKKWTDLEIRGIYLQNVILCDGKCYAVDKFGLMFFLDSELNPELVVASPVAVVANSYTSIFYMVKRDSDLYLVTIDDLHSDEVEPPPYQMRLYKLNECNDNWETIEDLGDMFFILSADASHCFFAKDFAGFKANRVYLYGKCYAPGVNGAYEVEDSDQQISPPSWFFV